MRENIALPCSINIGIVTGGLMMESMGIERHRWASRETE